MDLLVLRERSRRGIRNNGYDVSNFRHKMEGRKEGRSDGPVGVSGSFPYKQSFRTGKWPGSVWNKAICMENLPRKEWVKAPLSTRSWKSGWHWIKQSIISNGKLLRGMINTEMLLPCGGAVLCSYTKQFLCISMVGGLCCKLALRLCLGFKSFHVLLISMWHAGTTDVFREMLPKHFQCVAATPQRNFLMNIVAQSQQKDLTPMSLYWDVGATNSYWVGDLRAAETQKNTQKQNHAKHWGIL